MNEKLLELFEAMADSDIVAIWNEFCYETNNYDEEIFDADTLEEMINSSNESGLYWVNRFFFGSDDYGDNSANPNRDYFKFNGYGNIVSFDYIYNSYSHEFNHIDIDDLINYIVENSESFGNDEIAEILEEVEEVAD